MPRYEVKITTYTTFEADSKELAVAAALEALEEMDFDALDAPADFVAWRHDSPVTVEAGADEPQPDEPDDAQAALDAAAEAQSAFWDAMRRLENVVGFDVDQEQDLSGMTVDDLRGDDDEEEDEDDAQA